MDIATFRAVFPEFSNSTTYSDAQITFFLTQGTNVMNANIWGTLFDQGVGYYIAHNLVLAQRRAKSVASGGTPGVTQGAVSSKGVDKVNVSYDTNSVALEKGGMYNQTDYGIQFLQLSRMAGAQGIIQTNGSGWPGVDTGVFGSGYVN